MASTVKLRSNHYETLGLAPGATSDEVARAYAREIGRFGSRPVLDVAAASIAFETLRDPARRRDYDASLGLGVQLPPRIVSTGGRAQFIGSAPMMPTERPVHATLPPAAAPRQPSSRPQPAAELRTASFIAASLRPPVDRAAQPAFPIGPERTEAAPLPSGETQPTNSPRAYVHQPRDLRLADADNSPLQWSRTVAMGGGLIACVVLLGALLGLEAGNGEVSQPSKAAVTAALPAARPVGGPSEQARVPATELVEAQPRLARRAPVAAAAIERPSAATEAEAQPTEVAQTVSSFVDTGGDIVAAEPPVADAAVVEAAAALPLPKAVVARTIDRIGYACGQVASTSPIAGEAAGVFKVTCTSGQSYRAAPVRGRYHFHRLAGR